jgi:hypothetical protein
MCLKVSMGLEGFFSVHSIFFLFSAFIYLSFILEGCRFETQGFTFAKQVLYHFSHNTTPQYTFKVVLTLADYLSLIY